MKGRSLLIILILLSTRILYAQEYSDFQFGIKVGGNLYSSSMNIENIADKKLKVGYQVGLFGEYAFSESFYLHSGLFFVTKGVKIKGSADASSWSQSIGLQYLQVPLLATYKFELVSDTKVFFNVGPYIAYGIGGKSTRRNKFTDATRSDEKVELNSFGDNRMKKMDFGLKYSVGLEFERILFEWSYEFGLMNIENNDNKINSLFDNKHYKNKGLSLAVGYKF